MLTQRVHYDIIVLSDRERIINQAEEIEMIKIVEQIRNMTIETTEEIKGFALGFIASLPNTEQSEEIANFINHEFIRKTIDLAA